MSTLSKNRYWIVLVFITSLFVIIGYQLVQLTIVRRPALLAIAGKQHDLSIDIPPLRGQIFDRNGKELATNLKVPSIYAVPRLLRADERGTLALKVSQILNLDKEYVLEKLSKNKSFIWLKRKVTFEQAEKIQALESAALGVVKEYRRFYPQGDLLAQILGFADVDNIGLEGIELALNRELQGRAGKRITKRDALGREIKAFEIKQVPAVDGNNVTLTIDQYIQYLTERALDRAFKDWKAKGAMAVVMEAKTGKILAIASRPSYDPNQYEKSSTETRRNRVITDMYEPGSIFKIVAASGALNENVVTPSKIFNCENGTWHYGSRTLHDVHAYGNLSFEDVIVKSSNIGTVKIAALMDREVFQSYIQGFGFGRTTGFDLQGEAPGFTRPPSQWSNTSPYNIPIGQEVMVTPLQMVTAMAVIANGGDLVKPYIISKVEDQNGVILREKNPTIRRKVIRAEVAAIMRRILVRVVEEGTGKKAHIDGIPVGGKTGTAQKVLPNGRGYSHSNFMSSFIGFAPADEPQFVMAVVLDDPKPLYYGGTVAAPVFKEVMEAALLNRGYVPANATKMEPKRAAESRIPQNQPMLVRAEAVGTRL
jgi:cell division protein FtsI (penicillin-binding protein 3)